MINFNDVIVDDVIDYKSKDDLCLEYLRYIDLDYTIKHTFPAVIDNIVKWYNSKIITDLYLNNTDTYSLVPIEYARMRREYLKATDRKNREKYRNDYENHGILINHNLVNCLIAIFNEVGGCSVEKIPPQYSSQGCIVYDQMEGIKIKIARKYYPEKTVEEYYRDSSASVVKREILRNTLDSLDLGIADITPYLKIEYPTPYVLDDMSINPKISLKIGDYRLTQTAQQLVDVSPNIKRAVDEAQQLKMQQELCMC
jgi:hypothetical protein